MRAYRVSLFGSISVSSVLTITFGLFYAAFVWAPYHFVVLCTKICCIVLSILVNHVSRVSWQLMIAHPKKKKEIGGEGGNLRIHVFRSVIPFSDRFVCLSFMLFVNILHCSWSKVLSFEIFISVSIIISGNWICHGWELEPPNRWMLWHVSTFTLQVDGVKVCTITYNGILYNYTKKRFKKEVFFYFSFLNNYTVGILC